MKLIVAIASKRGPKIGAVRNVIDRLRADLGYASASVDYLTYDIDGGTAMPRTLEELMTGAEQRVMSLQALVRKEGLRADYFIGMEGGFHQVEHHDKLCTFLQSWAYVSNGEGGYFGSSGDVMIPDVISHQVMGLRRELGVVIDDVTSKTDIRSNEGTWGVLTKNHLTRQQSFEIALIAALAPFYNHVLYTSGPVKEI